LSINDKEVVVRHLSILVLALAPLTATVAGAACGDTIPTPQGGQTIAPPVVSWDDSLDQALQIAKIKNKPFGIYFSCKEDAAIIGENADVLREYMKANNNSLPVTASDVPRVVSLVRELGVGNFVKIKLNKENRALAEKYNAELNTLVVCSPSGERITAFKCTADVAKSIDSAKKDMTAWSEKK
jgi:hypothetical protein